MGHPTPFKVSNEIKFCFILLPSLGYILNIYQLVLVGNFSKQNINQNHLIYSCGSSRAKHRFKPRPQASKLIKFSLF